jgi:hypothetical protein
VPTSHSATSEIDGSPLGRLFSDTYRRCDERFHEACRAAGAEFVAYVHPLTGPAGEPLRLSACRLGAAEASHIVLVTSGTHGVEGYAGSAIQTGILRGIAAYDVPDDTAIVMIHAVNPWGLAWDRRESEENIDLFRNFIYCDPPYAENPLYDQLNWAINPTEWSGPVRMAAERAISLFIAEHGEGAYISAVRRGQHRHPRGLTFHGQGPSWSKRRVDEVASRFISPGARVANLEIHTSWGRLDECLSISYSTGGSPKLSRVRRWLGEPIYCPGADALIPQHPFTPFESLERQVPGIEVTAVVMECGTYEDMPLDLDRLANYVFMYGDPASPQGLEARATMRRYCYPDSEDWKRMVWERGEWTFRRLLERIHDW